MGKCQLKMIGIMLVFTLGMAVGCSSRTTEAPASPITITGAGSTFVAPLLLKWCEQYHQGTSRRGG